MFFNTTNPTDQLPSDCPTSISNAVVGTFEASLSMPQIMSQATPETADIGENAVTTPQTEPCRWMTETTIVERWSSATEAAIAMGNQSALAQHLTGPTPSVGLVEETTGGSTWTILQRQPSWPAVMVPYHRDLVALATGIGQSLRNLHDLKPEVVSELELVDSLGWDSLAEQVRSRVRSDDFEPAHLREPYNRYGADQLLEMFENGRPGETSQVVSHGNYTPANVLLSAGAEFGFIGLSAMRVIDRHFDLARMHLAIGDQIGSDAVFGFYEGYGLAPSIVAIDHYVFAHNLLSP